VTATHVEVTLDSAAVPSVSRSAPSMPSAPNLGCSTARVQGSGRPGSCGPVSMWSAFSITSSTTREPSDCGQGAKMRAPSVS
jgi:hypothetical protein